MQKEPKISVIIPVYAVEQYLDRCVQSVVSQSYKNLEIILVDDGSPDNCPALCDEWAKKDERIKVVHKPNGGLSDARNVGIETSTGEYIAFLDSDDCVHKEMYECLLNVVTVTDSDMVVCKLEKFSDVEPTQEPVLNKEIKVKELDKNGFLTELLSPSNVHLVVAVSKLYNRKIFNSLRFDLGKIHEDEFLAHKLLDSVEKVAVIDEKLYFYYVREGSITTSSFSKKRLHAIEAMEDRVEYVNEKFPQFVWDAIDQYLNTCMGLYCKAKMQNAEQEILDTICEKFMEMYNTQSEHSLKAKLFRYLRPVYYLLFKIKNGGKV